MPPQAAVEALSRTYTPPLHSGGYTGTFTNSGPGQSRQLRNDKPVFQAGTSYPHSSNHLRPRQSPFLITELYCVASPRILSQMKGRSL